MSRVVQTRTQAFLCSAIDLSPSGLHVGTLTSHHLLYSSLLEITVLGCHALYTKVYRA